MTRPRVNELGEVDIESIEALSRDDLRDWVYERLHGQDQTVPGDARGDDMPHYLLTLLYPKLNRPTREDLQEIIFEFLTDLARNPESEWVGEAGDELLMLVDPVLVQSPRREDAVDLLLEMVNSLHLTNTEPDLHFRVLQSLVALQHRADRDFWQRQVEIGEDQYAPVVLGGLALVNLSAVFDFLANAPWSDAIEDAIIGLLPSLLEDYGSAKVESQIEHTLPKLSPEGQEALRRFCEEEGLDITMPGTPPTVASEPTEVSANLREDPERFLFAICGAWASSGKVPQPEPARVK